MEFTPDLLDKLTLKVQGHEIFGRYFLQEYEAKGGQVAGQYANGHAAAVEHTFGKGKTLLIGTFPGGGYYLHHSPGGKAFFAGLLKWAGIEPQLQTNNNQFQARLHAGAGGNYLWITNPTRAEGKVTVSLNGKSPRSAKDLWDGASVSVADNKVTVSIQGRSGAVISYDAR